MEFKGTKGDWIVQNDFREPKILNNSNQVMITHSTSCYDTTEKSHLYYSHNKMMANIQLIASAPELLEACKSALEAMEIFVSDGYIMKNTIAEIQLRKSINKALGNETNLNKE